MYIITHIVVFTVLPVGLLLAAINKKWIPKIKRWFARILFAIVGKKPEVIGLENIEDGKAYLILPNYPSFYASFAMMGVFPDAAVVAQAFTAKIPVLGYFLRQMGTMFVDPRRVQSTFHTIDRGMKSNGGKTSVLIFPEGQRTPDGQIKQFKRGFTYILRRSSLDLLPVTLNGFYQMKPVKRFYFDPVTKPEIILHEPITNAQAKKMSDGELIESAQNIILHTYIK